MDIKLKRELSNWMRAEDIKVEEPMSNHTSFRVGGPAKIFLSIRSEEVLAKVLKYVKEKKIPYFVLGNGTNLLVSDQGYPGVILYLDQEFSGIKVENNSLCVGASALLSKVSKAAMEAGLTGLEFAAGIPGSMGGGTVMNAGAYGGELSQYITTVKAMDPEGNIVFLKNEEMEFGYRQSIFKRKNYVILEIILELMPGNKDDILKEMMEYNRARKEKQPLEYPSAGSTFKRPEGHFAGKLIMEAGLKGYQIGGAKVSEKHCGFVINVGDATCEDIKTIMNEIQKIIMEKFQVELEPEVIYLGE